jgi:hypothetical protein
MAPNLEKQSASPHSSYNIALDTGGNRSRGLNGVVFTHYLRFMPYKTHGVHVIAVHFTTDTTRRILNMISGVKFE